MNVYLCKEVKPSNYQKGIIYTIKAGDEVYYGSTIQTKEQRLTKHISDYKKWLNDKTKYTSSFDLFGKYDISNCKIELECEYPCNSREELEEIEGWYQLNHTCVNKVIAGRTMKDYRKDNIEKIKEYDKQKYLNNKEQILEYKKQKYLINKEQIKEKNKINFDCECGNTIRLCCKTRHINSKKHLDFLNNKEQKNQSYKCECGSNYTIQHKSRHFKTTKHLSFVKTI